MLHSVGEKRICVREIAVVGIKRGIGGGIDTEEGQAGLAGRSKKRRKRR